MSVSDPAAAAGQPIVIEQRARPASFLGLSLKNGLLNLVTLTLYRFWGKTEVRRRIWSTTYLNDEPFEYTGRGMELFIGFLLALLVLGLPFLIAVFGTQLLGPLVSILILPPLYLFLAVLIGYGQFTAFRYMASRTSWRGVRFLLRGSAWDYGLKYLGYGFLSTLTLGWFWPAAQRRLAEPLWHGLRFGDRMFRFDLGAAQKESVYRPYAIFWVGLIVGYFAFVGVMFGALSQMAAAAEDGAPPQVGLDFIVRLYAGLALFSALVVVLYAPYQAAILRSIARGIRFEDVRLELHVRWTEMAWLTLSNLVLALFSLGFLMPFIQARTAKFTLERLRTEGVADLSTVRQAADAGPRHGEGLADAFGVAPI
jgi:uncharacterized membrane protein YjgN (DUF898 family)